MAGVVLSFNSNTQRLLIFISTNIVRDRRMPCTVWTPIRISACLLHCASVFLNCVYRLRNDASIIYSFLVSKPTPV
jgi:hypothetical protein